MSMTIKAILLFFNDTTAPPPFPPLLTYQLELFSNGHHSSGLLVDEVLSPGSGNLTPAVKVKTDLERPQKPALAPKFKVVTCLLKPTHHLSPYSNKSSSKESEQSSETSSDTESTVSALSEASKIPKPPGEPGQPGRGSYNLKTALDWNHKTYMKFKKFTHHLVDDHLNVMKCSSA
ncbi:hypothetical protein HYDPIDRAFT_33144 [Hydnomerulius pinastri MD-312]|uniref:Uncharacterized protein n=1 Tax=Hydnomerulius pinastri MD-312 TaxID=994086 RepID=A0A0C9W0Q0_9AGAM|nr:hypothetical protein HYDPIDRAFT_33144 [Hydnomerulius pinastri MD-312]